MWHKAENSELCFLTYYLHIAWTMPGFSGEGSGWPRIKSHWSTPFESSLRIPGASSVVCPSFTFYSPHSLEENLATFFAVFRDMREIPQFSPLIQCGTLSTHRVFKGEPGFTAVSKICIYTGRNDWITWDENLFGNPHEGADYFWQV